jgi:hypothetical protein
VREGRGGKRLGLRVNLTGGNAKELQPPQRSAATGRCSVTVGVCPGLVARVPLVPIVLPVALASQVDGGGVYVVRMRGRGGVRSCREVVLRMERKGNAPIMVCTQGRNREAAWLTGGLSRVQSVGREKFG